MKNLWLRIKRRLVCDRRGHDIVQLPSPVNDTILILACVRCGLHESYPLRRLNRAERRARRKAA